MKITLRDLFWLVLVAVIGCSFATPVQDVPAMQTIATSQQFQDAIGLQAVIYIDVDWASQAILSRATVARFREVAKGDARTNKITVYRIDCTEQQGVLWDTLETWLEKQHADKYLLYGGNGAVLWIKESQLKDSVTNAAQVGEAALIARTVSVFSAKCRPA